MSKYIINENRKTIHIKTNRDSTCPSVSQIDEENITEFNKKRLLEEIKKHSNKYKFCKRCMPKGKKDIL